MHALPEEDLSDTMDMGLVTCSTSNSGREPYAKEHREDQTPGQAKHEP